MIEPAIVTLALADPATAALIGTRIFPLLLPDDCQKPAVSYRLVSTLDQNTLDGPLGLVQVRLQIDSWGDAYADAKNVAQALYNLLDDYTGTVGTVAIANIWRDAESTGFDQTVRAYYVQTDWMILFTDQ